MCLFWFLFCVYLSLCFVIIGFFRFIYASASFEIGRKKRKFFTPIPLWFAICLTDDYRLRVRPILEISIIHAISISMLIVDGRAVFECAVDISMLVFSSHLCLIPSKRYWNRSLKICYESIVERKQFNQPNQLNINGIDKSSIILNINKNNVRSMYKINKYWSQRVKVTRYFEKTNNDNNNGARIGSFVERMWLLCCWLFMALCMFQSCSFLFSS